MPTKKLYEYQRRFVQKGASDYVVRGYYSNGGGVVLFYCAYTKSYPARTGLSGGNLANPMRRHVAEALALFRNCLTE